MTKHDQLDEVTVQDTTCTKVDTCSRRVTMNASYTLVTITTQERAARTAARTIAQVDSKLTQS
eukprot:971653-Pleurochrysis_carterae.AAC.1